MILTLLNTYYYYYYSSPVLFLPAAWCFPLHYSLSCSLIVSLSSLPACDFSELFPAFQCNSWTSEVSVAGVLFWGPPMPPSEIWLTHCWRFGFFFDILRRPFSLFLSLSVLCDSNDRGVINVWLYRMERVSSPWFTHDIMNSPLFAGSSGWTLDYRAGQPGLLTGFTGIEKSRGTTGSYPLIFLRQLWLLRFLPVWVFFSFLFGNFFFLLYTLLCFVTISFLSSSSWPDCRILWIAG